MLTKSAAKAFFLGGTGLCSLAFVLLTLDTVKQFPDRSNESELTPQVLAGHKIWLDNNCMGCHTLLGEGAYYAPELTRVMDRRSPEWLAAFFADPQRMFPGRRKMVKYDFFDPAKVGAEQAQTHVDNMVAFFSWVSRIDTNGWPPEPDLSGAPRAAGAGGAETVPEPASVAAAPSYFRSVCVSCHAVEGYGGKVGPSLDGVANRFDADYLRRWISDPQAVKPGTTMPNLGLSPADLDAITTFLGTLKDQE